MKNPMTDRIALRLEPVVQIIAPNTAGPARDACKLLEHSEEPEELRRLVAWNHARKQ